MLPLKRLLFIASSFLIFFLFFVVKNTPVAHAQTYYSNYTNLNTNPDVPQDLHTYSHTMMLNVLSFVVCGLAGIDPMTPSHKCLGWDNSTQKIGYVNGYGGLLGFMTRTITLTYNLPIHSQPYINYLASNFHLFADKSYAANNEQGLGAKGLDPLLTIWVGFRNTAYLFVVIIFVVIGMLIMFRIKIDPRTVMTIQNQIPKIIIGLLAITFSFAIAGFLIDLMYVATYLILNITYAAVKNGFDITKLTSYTTPFGAANDMLPGGIGGAIAGATGSVNSGVLTVVNGNPITFLLNGIFYIITGIICAIAGLVSVVEGNGWSCSLDALGNSGGLVGIIVFIILTIAVLTALFRFWIALVTCYINILFNVILGPIRILFGMVPGGLGGGMGGWFKELIANLAVFPVSVGFIALAGAIATAVGNGNAFTPFFVPGVGVGGVLSFAAILMLPKLPDTVKEWFKVKSSGLGDSIGQTLGVGAAVLGAAGRQTGKRLFQRELSIQGQAEGWVRRLALGGAGTWRRRAFMKAAGEKGN